VEHLGRDDQMIFPVVDDEGHLSGIIDLADLGRVAKDYGNLSPLVLATDLAHPSETVLPNETLLDATRRMGVRGVSALPVLDAPGGKVIGVVSRHHVLAAYERAVVESADGDAGAAAMTGANVA